MANLNIFYEIIYGSIIITIGFIINALWDYHKQKQHKKEEHLKEHFKSLIQPLQQWHQLALSYTRWVALYEPPDPKKSTMHGWIQQHLETGYPKTWKLLQRFDKSVNELNTFLTKEKEKVRSLIDQTMKKEYPDLFPSNQRDENDVYYYEKMMNYIWEFIFYRPDDRPENLDIKSRKEDSTWVVDFERTAVIKTQKQEYSNKDKFEKVMLNIMNEPKLSSDSKAFFQKRDELTEQRSKVFNRINNVIYELETAKTLKGTCDYYKEI